MTRKPALSCLALAAAACGGGSLPEESARRDSAGVTIVTAPAADQALDWSWSARLRLGGADSGSHAFYAVDRSNTAVDAEGRIYVLDRQVARVVRFEPDGRVAWTAGGRGGGPGELLRPYAVAALGDGGVTVYDARKRALVPFDARGAALEQIPNPLGPVAVLAFDAQLLFKTRHYRQGASGDGYRFRLSLIGVADTALIAETPVGSTFSASFDGCGRATAQTVGPTIYAPDLPWHAHPSGIAANSTAGYVVDVYAAPGRLVRSIRRPGLGRPATRDDALAWAAANPIVLQREDAECQIPADEMVDKMGFADSVPAIADVALAPSGELWVRRWAPAAPGGPIDVHDETGAYVGTLPREFPFPLHFLPTGEPLFAERDENDVETLVVAVVRR